MSTLRSQHKAKIKQYLESLIYNTQSLLVIDHYVTTADRYPFVFITSGEIDTNEGYQSDMGYNGNYERIYQYSVRVIFFIDTGGINEIKMDDIEELILNKLQSKTVTDDTTWQDLRVLSVSSPLINEVLEQDNCIEKTFIVNIQTLIDKPA
jgi:hypothetical protein